MTVKWRKMWVHSFIYWGQEQMYSGGDNSTDANMCVSQGYKVCVFIWECVCVRVCIYAFFCSQLCLEALLQHCYLRRLIQHSLPLLFSSLFPIYECPSLLVSVCKHTTPGQSPTHIFCSCPIKHTLSNLLWSLFIRVRAIELKHACDQVCSFVFCICRSLPSHLNVWILYSKDDDT